MRLEEARIRFECGDLTGYAIAKAPLEEGWNLLLSQKFGVQVPFKTALGEVKVYKKIDTALGDAEKIGFQIQILKSA